MMLESCAVPSQLSRQIVGSYSKKPVALVAATERLASSLADYGTVLSRVHILPRMPKLNPGDEDPKESDLDAIEHWRVEVEDIEKMCRRWELLSGVPFYASLGSHYLIRSTERDETLVSVLKRALAEINSIGC